MGAVRDAARAAIQKANGEQARAMGLFRDWFNAKISDDQAMAWLIEELHREGYEVTSDTAKSLADEAMRLSGGQEETARSMLHERLDQRENPASFAASKAEIDESIAEVLVALFEDEWRRGTDRA